MKLPRRRFLFLAAGAAAVLFDAWLAGGKGTEVLRYAKKAAMGAAHAEPMSE